MREEEEAGALTFLGGLGVKGDGTSWSLGVLVAISTTVSVFVHLVQLTRGSEP